MELGFGPGAGPRLLAPGNPDWIGTDGVRLGWTLRDRLFLLEGDRVRVVDLVDEASAACPGPTHWTVAVDAGFVLVDAAAGEAVGGLYEEEREPLRLLPGADVGLLVAAPEHQLLRLHDGRALPLPDGALRARFVAPWTRGPGACWVDMDTLYRMRPRIRALAKVAGCAGLATGPEGAVLAQLKRGCVLAAPRGEAVEVDEDLLAENARFSPDGRQLLASDGEAVLLVDSDTGKVLRRWEGEAIPVGFGPSGPWRLCTDRGEVRDAEDQVVAAGFCGPSPALGGDWIVGPGGRIWSRDGTLLRSGLPDGVAGTDGHRVVVVDREQLHLLDGPSLAHPLCAEEDVIRRVDADAERILVQTWDGELGVFGWDGQLRERRRDPGGRESSPVEGAPLPADGVLERGGERLYWTEDGLLARI